MNEVYRILDAAANRTREGLRVIEDFVRFALDDAHLSETLKRQRHSFASIIARLPPNDLLAARDTQHDVGTVIGTETEYQRSSSRDVVVASFKRVQEALRTLEEYSKVVDVGLAPQFEQLRYQLYTIEKAVIRTESAIRLLQSQNLYLLVQADQCAAGLETVVKSALDAGVRIVQLREKMLSDRELVRQARRLREWTAAADALLVINDRPDIAVISGADGVHVGQEELTVRDVRRIVGADCLVGFSTHSIEQARQAVLDGADYLGVGPTFPSGTKSFFDFPGLTFVSRVASEVRLPWFAIGGIDLSNVGDVIAAGADRIALSGSICRDPEPKRAAVDLQRKIAEAIERRQRDAPKAASSVDGDHHSSADT